MKQSPTRPKEETDLKVDYRSVFEAVPDACLILSANEDFVIVAVTQSYLVATMTSNMEIIGKKLFEVFPDNPDDLGADGVSNLRSSLREVLRTKETHKMAIQKYDIRRPNGVFEERFWSPTNKPVLNADGSIDVIIHHVEDVTEHVIMQREADNYEEVSRDLRKQISDIELEMLKRRHNFSTVFYKSPVISSITDASDGKFIDVNERFINFCGLPKDQIIGRSSVELGMIIDPERRLEIIEEIREKGFTTDRIMSIWAQGKSRWVSSSAHLVHIDGRACFLTGMVDVTDRVNADLMLEEANKELESFCYSISHDLRAPLRAIDGYARILVEEHAGELTDEGNRLMHVITSNTKKMAILIDDLLAFSRLGKQPMVKVTVNMNKLARSAGEEAIRNSKNEMTKINYGTLPEMECDSSMMRLVYNNLLSNAVKYSGKKDEPIIEIGAKMEKEEMIFYVKDNGAGFDMNYYDKLFGVFQRLHSAVEFEGTGVGLALTQRIIHRHGGRIWAESVLDEGTTFYFTLSQPKPKE